MQYTEYKPSPGLKGVVECYWTLSFSKDAPFRADELLFPDGSVEWLFPLSGNFSRKEQGTKDYTNVSGPVLIGHRLKCMDIQQSIDLHMFVIRFTPFGLGRLIRHEPVELLNNLMPSENVRSKLTNLVFDILKSAQSIDNKIMVLNQVLEGQLSSREVHEERLLIGLWNAILESKGGLRIADFCKRYGVSQSTLSRISRREMGLTPKQLANVIRMNFLVYSLLKNSADLTKVALTNGFYDQSHMIRVFHSYAGCSPGQFQKAGYIIPATLGTLVENRVGELKETYYTH